jgi:phosphoglycerate dehydrogenase-like enzyme
MNRRVFFTRSTAVAAGLAAAPVFAHETIDPPLEPLKVLIPPTDTADFEDLRAAAPSAELVVCRSQREAQEKVAEAHATYGFITPALIRNGPHLRWVQQPSAGVETVVTIPELVERPIILTNMQRVYAPEIADQAIAYLLAFTRGFPHFMARQRDRVWAGRQGETPLDELAGKTLLVVGLGGIGQAISQRAAAFGMSVIATDPKVYEKPLYVAELHRPEALDSLLPKADVVASAAPLTLQTRKLFDGACFGRMKKGVVFVNVSRGGLVDTSALVDALKSGHVAAAGLDVTDPEPLPSDHALWTTPNVIITPHSAGQSPGGMRRRHALFRENLRRFAAGEMLLNIVDKAAGY